MASIPLLDVRDLTVEFATRNGTVRAIDSVSLSVHKGEILGVVGESGSGKSVTSYAVMRILDRAGNILEGETVYGGMDLAQMPEADVAELRGREISMIFQNPRTALNPIRKVGHQIEDVLHAHAQAVGANLKVAAIDALKQVRIANPEQRYHSYPFELSGGMCQRIVIAIALACRPQLLIADEPTTGLDVTTQKAIMDLVVDLARERNMGALLITHDLGLASAYCDRIVVMQDGKIVDQGTTDTLFANPGHPYTERLIRATPRPDSRLRDLLPDREELTAAETPEPSAMSTSDVLLEVKNLVKTYPVGSSSPVSFVNTVRRRIAGTPPETFRAVSGISFSVGAGESIGLVGESGCGKSTTSSMVSRLIDKTEGEVIFDGVDIGAVPAKDFARHPLRPAIQMVFQDPTESLNPRFTAFQSISDPMRRLGGVTSTDEAWSRAETVAEQVGLPAHLLTRFPHQLSGGQKARVGIARAIALHPKLLILDEPTSALDVSVQAVVLNLLADLRQEMSISYIFVSHDLNVVRLLCDRVIVMNAGEIVEQGPADQILSDPQMDYTKSLVAAIPHFRDGTAA
ncbi:MAG: peptide/nickel transport system ATP-binding protein [Alphaproteobacteria bacterium]|jgi:peptide/nickel transport system ATP-binding protein